MEETKKSRAGRAVLTVIIIVAVLAAALVFGFRLKSLEIKGNSRVNQAKILELTEYDKYGGNTLLYWFMNRDTDVSSESMLKSITVEIEGPQSVTVNVLEETLAAGITLSDRYCYFNENGIAIAESSSAIDGIPEVLGISVTGWTPEEKVSVAEGSESDFDDACSIARILSNYEMQIDWIRANGDRTFTLIFGNIQVQLGKNIYMEEKISELADLWNELQSRSGILHLEDYEPGSDSIIFTNK
ncbi:MAG: hypothetical protein K5637_04075 [Lachnospiraceae bacterium]|nr:hypothetical protein [Lachnospiraceae bacterium]